MFGWIIIVLAIPCVIGLGALLTHMWGRGAHESMSEKMET